MYLNIFKEQHRWDEKECFKILLTVLNAFGSGKKIISFGFMAMFSRVIASSYFSLIQCFLYVILHDLYYGVKDLKFRIHHAETLECRLEK